MTFTRRSTRIITNALPAWRAAMASTDTLYYVTGTSGAYAPGLAPALAGMPTHFGQAGSDISSGAGWDVMSGYSSGTLLEDVGGSFGTMVYGTGGHTRVQNQVLQLDISADVPTYSWWQQPYWQTSSANGAEIYYSPSEQAALLAGPRGAAAVIPSNEDPTGWDKAFPVAFDGWIWPAKITTGQLGNNQHYGFRFSTTCYVPPSVTGSDGMYLHTIGRQGPFSNSFKPDLSTNAEWVDPSATFDGGTQRKYPFYLKNTRTGAWTEHKWQPDYEVLGIQRQAPGVFRDLRRVYVSGDRALGRSGWWYIDFSTGSPVVSARVEPATAVSPNRYTCGAWTDGHPTGRHLVFFPDLADTGGLVYQDFDNGTQGSLHIGGVFDIPAGLDDNGVGITYDAALNRILVTRFVIATGELHYFSLYLPADPLNAAGYTVSKRVLARSDPSGMASVLSGGVTFMYRKTYYHPTLGVIFIVTDRNRVLAFRPAP